VLFNRVHSWYRATVEHVFGYVKRYRIINSTYRGRLLRCPQYIKRAVRIIMSLSNIHLRSHPHRRHIPLVAGSVDVSSIDFDALEVRRWDDNVGTDHTVDDFYCGQGVEVRLPTAAWMPGIVRYRNRAQNTVTILFTGSRSGDFVRVDPRLVRHRQ
jgi:hypothetical protein